MQIGFNWEFPTVGIYLLSSEHRFIKATGTVLTTGIWVIIHIFSKYTTVL